MQRTVTLLVVTCLLTCATQGQCPDRDSSLRRIVTLKLMADSTPAAARTKLLDLEKELAACNYMNDSVRVLMLRALSSTFLYEGNYLEVIRHLNQAAGVIKRSAYRRSTDGRDLVHIYYYIAYAYKQVDNVPESMKALENCITASRTSGYNDRSSLSALYDRGQYFFDLGDYHRCIDYFRECNANANQYLPHAETSDDSASTMSYAHGSFAWQVNAHVRLRQYDMAQELLHNQVNNEDLRHLSAYQGTYYGLKAEMELHKGNHQQAISDLQRALSVEKKAFSRKQLLNTLANEVYFRRYHAYDKALALFKEALTNVNKDPRLYKEDSVESVNIWSNMAELYVEKGQFDQAFDCFRRALNHIRPGISTAEIVNSPPATFVSQKKTHYLTGLFVEQANAWRKKYGSTHNPADLRNAIAAFKEADQLVNRIKTEQANISSKLFWRSSSHGLYEMALEACYASGNQDDAFYFFEKSRAVLLNDQLADQRWMGEQDILQQTQAMKRINALNRELADPRLEADKRATLQAEKASHQQLLDRLRTNIKSRNPFYYQNFLDSNFISLPQVQQTILKDYGALVEVFSGDSAVYLMVIDARRTQLRRIDRRAYDQLANQFIRYITDYAEQNTHYETFSRIAHQLYQLIFDKVSLPPGRLIISPDGPYFPFEALLTSQRPGSFLLRDHAISYTYSARYLLNDFAIAPGRETRSFMGFAPVRYSGVQLPELPELTESDRSLQSLTGYFSTADNYIGKDASRHNFLQHFTDYRIIQLYTHAVDNKENGEPVIYFADSLLYLSDLVSDKRPATSLVVLSACETGTGRFYQGEGVFSFNRGFAALGIPAAITSLWKADNRKTYALTALFYKYLSGGEPADVALQHAKLEFMNSSSKENMLPYFWAVPVLTGKITDIPAPEGGAWWLIVPAIALAAILVVASLGWWRRRKKARPSGQAYIE